MVNPIFPCYVSQGSTRLDSLGDSLVSLMGPLAPCGPAPDSSLTAPERLLLGGVVLPLGDPPQAVLLDTASDSGHFCIGQGKARMFGWQREPPLGNH